MVIFDVKTSMEDVMTDKRWTDQLPYCHEFYILTTSELESFTAEAIKEVDCGQLVDTDGGLKMVKPDHRLVDKVNHQEELKFSAGMLLSRKVIYRF